MESKLNFGMSYTMFGTWKTCPQKYAYRYIERLPSTRPKSPQAERGTAVHNSIERFFKGEHDELHPEIAGKYGQWMTDLRGHPAHVEYRFAVNADWEPVEYKDPEAQWRGFIDLWVLPSEGNKVNTLFEWKTGGIYDDHAEQADLYATCMQSIAPPEVKETNVLNVYLDKGKNVQRGVNHLQLRGAQVLWENKRRGFEYDNDYVPNPGYYCRWCDYAKDNGGPCRF